MSSYLSLWFVAEEENLSLSTYLHVQGKHNCAFITFSESFHTVSEVFVSQVQSTSV